MMTTCVNEKVYTLFALIHEYHMELGTDPTFDYKALRHIIEDRSIVSGKSSLSTMMQNLQTLRDKFPQYNTFFDLCQKLYDEDDDVEESQSSAPAPSPTPVVEELLEPLLLSQTVNKVEEVRQSIVKTVETPCRRRRWWLLFLA